MTKKRRVIFRRGDHVRIADDLGPSMSHFPGAGEEAVVEYSYDDRYGGGDRSSLGLRLKDGQRVAWYHENQLTLIRRSRVNFNKAFQNEIDSMDK